MKHAVAILTFLASIATVYSQTPANSMGFNADLTWQGQSWPTTGTFDEANGIEASPLYGTYGAFFILNLDQLSSFRFGMELFMDDYLYKESLDLAFPTQIESGKQLGPLASVLGLTPYAAYQLELFPEAPHHLGLEAGLSLLLRLALFPLDNSTGIEQITLALNRSLKIIVPLVGVYGVFSIPNGPEFGPYLRAYVPIARLWDGEHLPMWDTLMVSLGFHVRWDLPTNQQSQSELVE